MRTWLVMLLILAGCAAPTKKGASEIPVVSASVATDAAADDPDDPAIWVNGGSPSGSLILGTNKTAAPDGALLVFSLDGRMRQRIAGIDRPNNVDVEYGLLVDGQPTDIAVLTERYARRLLVYRIPRDGGDLVQIGTIPVFQGQSGEEAEPMGIALYRRPADGTIFAIVGRKSGPRQGYLWQYRLAADDSGTVIGEKVREFGAFSGREEIEAIAVDDELGFVYFADEGAGIRKWSADPDSPEASRELALFGREGFDADREGIAIYATGPGTGYLVCTDQIEGSSRYRLYRREGEAGDPHNHTALMGIFAGGADSTDGIEATSAPLGDRFPKGLFVAMNSRGRNFLLYDWRRIETLFPQR